VLLSKQTLTMRKSLKNETEIQLKLKIFFLKTKIVSEKFATTETKLKVKNCKQNFN